MLTVLFAPGFEFDLGYICEIFYSEDLISFEEYNREDETLVNSVKYNASPHLRSDHFFFT